MNQKKIILFLIIFLLISFFYLTYVEKKQADLNYQKNWWALYFENPKDESLNFTIENHSSKNNFHWEVLVDNDKLKEADINIAKGNSAKINLSDIDTQNFENKKISVKVSADDEMKEIYKNF